MSEKPLSLIFFGSPEFALPSLDALCHSRYEIAAVVTRPDKPKGRGKRITPTPVAHAAQSKNIPVIKSSKITPDILKKITSYNCPLGVVVAYGALLPQELLDIFPMGVLNIHPSLLPKYRGASPLQGPILAGDIETGVTIMLLDAGLDSGPVVLQESVTIKPHDTVITLHDTLAKKGALLLMQSIEGLVNSTLIPKEQDHKKASFTTKIKKQDGEIDWNVDAEHILRNIRAYMDWPGSFTYWNEKKLTILHANKSDITIEPGKVQVNNNELLIGTGSTSLAIQELQLEGKQKNTVHAFLQGHSSIDGVQL